MICREMKIIILFNIFLILLFAGCGAEKNINNTQEFDAWMNEKKNELKVSRSVNGVVVTVNYLPPEYNALKEMESTGLRGQKQYDSLLTYYKNSAAFVMTLAPDESKKNNSGDIMYKGVKNFKEYIERALALNFNLENEVDLEVNGSTYTPVLSSLDNTYSLSNDRKINFVFAPVKDKEEMIKAIYYDFVYHDSSFDLGTLHFFFDKKKIENNLPEISLP